MKVTAALSGVSNAVIIGASFIGVEAANAIKIKNPVSCFQVAPTEPVCFKPARFIAGCDSYTDRQRRPF